MQELVDSFKVARPAVLDFATTNLAHGPGESQDEHVAEGPATKKRKIDVSGTETTANDHTDLGMRTRSRTRNPVNTSLQEEDPITIEDRAEEHNEPSRVALELFSLKAY